MFCLTPNVWDKSRKSTVASDVSPLKVALSLLLDGQAKKKMWLTFDYYYCFNCYSKYLINYKLLDLFGLILIDFSTIKQMCRGTERYDNGIRQQVVCQGLYYEKFRAHRIMERKARAVECKFISSVPPVNIWSDSVEKVPGVYQIRRMNG